MNFSRPLFCFAVLASIFALSGCVLPYSESGTTVYGRTTANGRTNEYLIVVGHYYGYGAPLTPEGPQYITHNYKRHYYFSDKRVRRKSLSFLTAHEGQAWEVFAPVEGTNYWVRAEGLHRSAEHTNSILVTVFTPRRLLYKNEVRTESPPEEKRLHFDNSNQVLTYQSEKDNFTYNVLENSFDSLNKSKQE